MTPTFARCHRKHSAILYARPVASAVLLAVLLTSCAETPSDPTERPLLAVAGSGGAYTALLDDDVSSKVRSDQGTLYVDGVDCIHSHGSGGGFYQLRTINNTGECKAVQRPDWRWFTIDLGPTNTFDLDQDGIAEPIEQAPGRLLAPDAFANRATSTSVRIFILQVNPDGSTTQEAAWDLVYTVAASVSTTPTAGRVITAGSGQVTVSKPTQVGRKVVFSQVGTVQLPFKLTLEPQP